MLRRQFMRALSGAVSASLLTGLAARAQSSSSSPAAPPSALPRKPDLGDAAQGTYAGDVISDSKGSSKSDVTLTVTRIGRNRIRVTSDYPRLPVVEVPLTSAMGKILQQNGNSVFLLDPKKSHLDVSFLNEVSWSGSRR
jgi:hypothetical protein